MMDDELLIGNHTIRQVASKRCFKFESRKYRSLTLLREVLKIFCFIEYMNLVSSQQKSIVQLEMSHGEGTTEEQVHEDKKEEEKIHRKMRSRVRKSYHEWYLNEAAQFLDPFTSNKDLRKSRIHKNSRCIYLQKIDQSQSFPSRYSSEEESSDESGSEESGNGTRNVAKDFELGSVWSRKEKQLFFHHLSRHSIHNLDAWCGSIPTKSKIEILVYYSVLKDNLRLLKNLNTKKHGGILTYKRLPIAYEMNEQWIALEEELSSEPIKLTTAPTTLPPPSTTTLSSDNSLISWQNWYKRWSPVYSRHRLMDYYPSSREPMHLENDAMDLLEKLTKAYTRKLLREVVIPVLDRKSVPKTTLQNYKIMKTSRSRKLRGNCTTQDISDNNNIAFSTSNIEFPHIVTEQNVIDALVRLRLYRGNKHSLTYPESIVESINKFDLHVQDGKLFKNKNIIKHLQVPLLVKSANIYAAPLQTSSTIDENISIDHEIPEQHLQVQLDEDLDRDDLQRSAKYGHVLITWLMIARDARQSRNIFRVSLLDHAE